MLTNHYVQATALCVVTNFMNSLTAYSSNGARNEEMYYTYQLDQHWTYKTFAYIVPWESSCKRRPIKDYLTRTVLASDSFIHVYRLILANAKSNANLKT